MTEIQLQLTLSEVNQILDALGEKTFKDVYHLIIKVRQQAESQLQRDNADSNDHPTNLASESNE